MTKPYQSTSILFLGALCFLSLFYIAQSNQPSHFFVQGQVYCDTCRAQFITKVSTYMADATVRLECRGRENETLTYSVEGVTDKTGMYHLLVNGDHEEEICEINLIKSSDPECSEINKDGFARDVARVSLASAAGIATDIRLANPIGFMKKEALPECKQILEELGVLPDH